MLTALCVVVWTAIVVLMAMWVALADAMPTIPGETAIFGTLWPVKFFSTLLSHSCHLRDRLFRIVAEQIGRAHV